MTNVVRTRKKLIEVALPLEAINDEGSRRKRKAPAGYPTTLHKWWAQRPLAAARAVTFAQMVDDPSAHPDLYPTERKQQKERQRLFRIVEDLIKWENTSNEPVLQAARDEILQSWRRTCADNADHPHAKGLFNRHSLPVFHDPFAGSGALPLEAQRLGIESYASDLNPVAVLINKAMIEIPARFSGRGPVRPIPDDAQAEHVQREWRGAQGLAEDVRHYGQWMRDEAEKRIGHLFPRLEITEAMLKDRPDLEPLLGRTLDTIAWLWARTVKSPNPAFATVDVPLVSTFMLSTAAGRQVYIDPVLESGDYRFTVKVGSPKDAAKAASGTKLEGANFVCLMSGAPISGDYIKSEAKAGRMGVRLMAIVADGGRGRVYLDATRRHEEPALGATPTWRPEGEIATRMTGGNCTPYGLTSWADLFTPRQLVTLTTFSDLVQEVRERVRLDGVATGMADRAAAFSDGGSGATAYGDAVATYLSFAISRLADYGSSLATWRPKDNAMRSTLPKQAVQMTWDYAEGSPFGRSSAGFLACVGVVARVIDTALCGGPNGHALNRSVREVQLGRDGIAVVSTDPPYYNNIGYADLSDFFYVWLRRALRTVFPDLFATLAVPKADELVATRSRHGSEENAKTFFVEGMTDAMHRIALQTHPAFPVTIYYAYKQSETETDTGTASTGWETFLDAVIRAGFAINGTWPMRTEGDNRQVGLGANALASSIVLVCRARASNAVTATRGEFVAALNAELPGALAHLQRGNIAPVDLAQAAIGPGMAVYTRYASVLDARGESLTVRDALALINQTLDEALAKQEGDFDADSRWALTWFEQSGFAAGEYGVAEQLSKSKNTSVAGMVAAGILESKRGKVRLLKPDELPPEWDPATDARSSAWEVVHHLIRALHAGGEGAAATLVGRLGSKAESARELAYRLYSLSERKKRTAEALSYNTLVQSWPELTRLAKESDIIPPPSQGELTI